MGVADTDYGNNTFGPDFAKLAIIEFAFAHTKEFQALFFLCNGSLELVQIGILFNNGLSALHALQMLNQECRPPLSDKAGSQDAAPLGHSCFACEWGFR